MSVSSRTPATGPSATAGSSSSAGSRGGDRDPAGLLLARLSVAPVLIATAFLLASFPLLVIGWFRPVSVIGLSVIVAAVITPLGWRRLPGLRPGKTASVDARLWAQPGHGGQPDARRTPWWATAGVLVIAVAFFAFQAAYHSQFLIMGRDPGSYMQFATWIAGHGKLPITTSPADFGGAR